MQQNYEEISRKIILRLFLFVRDDVSAIFVKKFKPRPLKLKYHITLRVNDERGRVKNFSKH